MSIQVKQPGRYSYQALLLLVVSAFCWPVGAQNGIESPAQGNLQIDKEAVKGNRVQQPSTNIRLRRNGQAARSEADQQDMMEKKAQNDEEQAGQAAEAATEHKRDAGKSSRDTLNAIKDSQELKTQSIRSLSGE